MFVDLGEIAVDVDDIVKIERDTLGDAIVTLMDGERLQTSTTYLNMIEKVNECS